MVEFLLFLMVLALCGVCFLLAQVVGALTVLSASSMVDALKKAGIVDEIREAVAKRAAEERTS